MSYKYVGKWISQIDAFEKITGMSTFVADVEVPGMLYGKFLRSPHAHARIVKIDTSRAQKIGRYR